MLERASLHCVLMGDFVLTCQDGSTITVAELPANRSQGDIRFVEVLEQMGCKLERGPDAITVHGKDGKEVKVGLNQNAISTFRGDFITFQHGKEQTVTSTALQTGINRPRQPTENLAENLHEIRHLHRANRF